MKNKIRLVVGVIATCLITSAILPIPQISAQRTITVEDSLGDNVEVPHSIERIVTLTPAALEVVWALGAENKVVGIDQFSKWNDEFFLPFRDKPSVGLPPMPNYEKIIDLSPQVVITFANPPLCYPKLEDGVKAAGIKVVRLNFNDPKAYDREVKVLGQMLGKKKRAEEFLNFSGSWVNEIEERVKGIPLEERVMVYYEWIKPYTIYGKETGPSQLITMAGGVNVAMRRKS
jgi:iron complex transport system substrate-binding protein